MDKMNIWYEQNVRKYGLSLRDNGQHWFRSFNTGDKAQIDINKLDITLLT